MILELLASLTVPMHGVVTQRIREHHQAIDIACMIGEPIYAAHDGVGRGNTSHTHGNTFILVRSDGLETRYSHMDTMKPAGSYKAGEQIGTCGNTGSWSTGPHLHFEASHLSVLNFLYNPSH